MNNNFLVDFHTHILPSMDDGAKDETVSLKMLDCLKKQGVNTVCLTSHFYPYKETLESFLERRENAFKKIAHYSSEIGIKLVLASETFFNDYLFHTEDISQLCMCDNEGQLYLLTEMPINSSFSDRTINRISRLIDSYSVCPVLAHIERYPKLVNNPGLISRLIDMGCLMQINLSAFDKNIFFRKKLLRYIKHNFIHVVGTDSHNMEQRSPAYQNGISIIEKSLGAGAVKQIGSNALQIISGM
jgi:protein-tyrosine phosphatase